MFVKKLYKQNGSAKKFFARAGQEVSNSHPASNVEFTSIDYRKVSSGTAGYKKRNQKPYVKPAGGAGAISQEATDITIFDGKRLPDAVRRSNQRGG